MGELTLHSITTELKRGWQLYLVFMRRYSQRALLGPVSVLGAKCIPAILVAWQMSNNPGMSKESGFRLYFCVCAWLFLADVPTWIIKSRKSLGGIYSCTSITYLTSTIASLIDSTIGLGIRLTPALAIGATEVELNTNVFLVGKAIIGLGVLVMATAAIGSLLAFLGTGILDIYIYGGYFIAGLGLLTPLFYAESALTGGRIAFLSSYNPLYTLTCPAWQMLNDNLKTCNSEDYMFSSESILIAVSSLIAINTVSRLDKSFLTV